MPELSRFDDVVIAIYYRDPGPPHFHAIGTEYEATINIATGEVDGFLPKAVLERLQDWRQRHQVELTEAWKLAESRMPLSRIAPLE